MSKEYRDNYRRLVGKTPKSLESIDLARVQDLNFANIQSVDVISSGVWAASPVSIQFGGTAQSGYSAGDILYSNGANSLSVLPSGSEGQSLNIKNGVFVWGEVERLGIVREGTWTANPVSIQYGGTAQSGYSAGDILYAGSTNSLSVLASGSEGQQLGITGGSLGWITDVASASGMSAPSVTPNNGQVPVFDGSTGGTKIFRGFRTATYSGDDWVLVPSGQGGLSFNQSPDIYMQIASGPPIADTGELQIGNNAASGDISIDAGRNITIDATNGQASLQGNIATLEGDYGVVINANNAGARVRISSAAGTYFEGLLVTSTPNAISIGGHVAISGLLTTNYSAQAAAVTWYPIGSQEMVFVIDSTPTVTVLLPPSPSEGEKHTVKGITGTWSNITVHGSGNLIDGAATATASGTYPTETFIYNGSEWSII